MMVPFGLLTYQGYLWLKTGYWTPYPTGKILIPILPDSFLSWLLTDSWLGLKKIIIGAMDIPIGIFSFIFGMGILWASFTIGWGVDEPCKTAIEKKKSEVRISVWHSFLIILTVIYLLPVAFFIIFDIQSKGYQVLQVGLLYWFIPLAIIYLLCLGVRYTIIHYRNKKTPTKINSNGK